MPGSHHIAGAGRHVGADGSPASAAAARGAPARGGPACLRRAARVRRAREEKHPKAGCQGEGGCSNRRIGRCSRGQSRHVEYCRHALAFVKQIAPSHREREKPTTSAASEQLPWLRIITVITSFFALALTTCGPCRQRGRSIRSSRPNSLPLRPQRGAHDHAPRAAIDLRAQLESTLMAKSPAWISRTPLPCVHAPANGAPLSTFRARGRLRRT